MNLGGCGRAAAGPFKNSLYMCLQGNKKRSRKEAGNPKGGVKRPKRATMVI